MEKQDNKPDDIFHVLIPASGQGRRLGSQIPKQYLKLAGKMILRRTIESFLSCRNLGSLRVIIDPKDADLYQEAVSGLHLPPPVPGGETRKTSVYNGIMSFSHLKDKDKILIHDAVRPFIKTQDILNVVKALDHHQAASLGVETPDTLRRDAETIDRNHIWQVQTPQGFHYGIIKKAHETHQNLEVTDDTELVSALGIPVKMVQGSRMNFKITTEDDLSMAQMIAAPLFDIRTGSGFDVHAFDHQNKNRPLVLCGVTIPHFCGLLGHSDADVGLHALTDALLGAIGAGDIGMHFPPENPAFKNMDSTKFLLKALSLIQEKNAFIQNIDITLICEEPKIGPYRQAMRAKISEILELDPSLINIKATTTEGLGFTGRREGIAAQATATIKIPS